MVFCEEVVDLADKAGIYRPLGASYVLLCVMAAWCSCSDFEMRVRLEEILVDYQGDTVSKSSASVEGELQSWFRRLRLLDVDNCPMT